MELTSGLGTLPVLLSLHAITTSDGQVTDSDPLPEPPPPVPPPVVVSSSTVTTKEQLLELPQLSRAVNVTVVDPIGNVLPLATFEFNVIVPPQLSVTVGEVHVYAA